MPERYNIALLPSDATLNAAFVALAQAEFSTNADDYLLGELALPHVTLCQFLAPSAERAIEAFRALAKPKTLVLKLEKLTSRQQDETIFWAHFSVGKEVELLKLQGCCHRHLSRSGFDVRTDVETYDPHVTLARLNAQPVLPALMPQWSDLSFQAVPCLGKSTEAGVFTQVIARG